MPLSLHLFGPFSIHVYGVFIVLGVSCLVYALTHDKQAKAILSREALYNLTTYGIIAGVLGGKLLYLLEQDSFNWSHGLIFWQEGFSILGTIIGVCIAVISYIHYHGLPFFPLADRIALYTPLAQGISRFGCFFTGCCHGIPTAYFLKTTYKNPESFAPLHVALHPTQLYSAFILFTIFMILFIFGQKKFQKPGQLFSFYLLLMGIERFVIDIVRDDRIFVYGNYSLMQLIATGVSLAGFILLLLSSFTKTFSNSSSQSHPHERL